MRAALLTLADGRLPAGGYAHSSGIEPAIERGRVRDIDSLRAFVEGRLWTAGVVAAASAAVVAARPDEWAAADVEVEARITSSAQRAASRALGSHLLRAARSVWPTDARREVDAERGVDTEREVDVERGVGAHHCVVLGLVADAAGLAPFDAELVAAHAAVSTPAWAAVRVLGLDPVGVTSMIASLHAAIDEVATHSVTRINEPLRELPCPSAPLSDVDAEDHATWEVRLFAS